MTKPKAEALLRSLFDSIEEVRRRASFNNTLTDNCTTNIVKYAERVSFWDRWFDYRILLPGYSDGLAYDLGASPPTVRWSKPARPPISTPPGRHPAIPTSPSRSAAWPGHRTELIRHRCPVAL